MASPAERPPERQQWHFRSVGQYILVGLVIAVGGILLGWWLISVISGDDGPGVGIDETPEVNIDEAAEVTIEAAEVTIEQAEPEQTSEPPPEPSEPPEPPREPTAGDCERFPVYAQGRWPPPGTAVRTEPTIAAPKDRSIQPNVIISVDGWVRSDAPYPTNDAPWNENVWFRLTDDSGWVSFAGVRASPSHPGGTDGIAEGGWPVELLDECEIPSLTKK